MQDTSSRLTVTNCSALANKDESISTNPPKVGHFVRTRSLLRVPASWLLIILITGQKGKKREDR